MRDRGKLYTAKITCPKISNVIHRKRLFSLLDTARKRPITWITGPGGSGKTTLVADYLNRLKLPHVWYQIDNGDDDPATFFYYLGVAARNATPNSRKQLPLFTIEYFPNGHIFSKRFFELLYVRLKSLPILVFDNYNNIPTDSTFHNIIIEGLSNVPPNLQIFFISRHEPPPAFAKFRANNAISCIGWNDLKLTLSETEAFVYTRTKTRLSHAKLKQLHAKTDGWAAGLVLITERSEEILPILRQHDIHNRREIFNYFAKELFDYLPNKTRQFLMKTALFQKITVSSALSLTDMSDADRILSEMVRYNFFTTQYGQNGGTYQYHPLFREFLLTCIAKKFDVVELKSLKRKAAFALAKEEQYEDAIKLFLQSDDFAEATRLICSLAPGMLSQGRVLIVKKWIDTIPPHVAEQVPWLLYWLGICTMQFNPAASEEAFDKAFKIFKSQKDQAGMLLAWCGGIDNAFIRRDYSHLDQMITLLETMLSENPVFPSAAIADAVSISMFGALARRQPHHSHVKLWENRVMNTLLTSQDQSLCCKAGFYLIAYYLLMGDLVKASSTLDQLRKVLTSAKITDLTLLYFKCTEALHDYFYGYCDNCLRHVFEIIKLVEKTGICVIEDLVVGPGIVAALSKGDIGTADLLLKRIQLDDSAGGQINHVYYYFAKTWMAMIQKDTVIAQQHCKTFMDYSNMTGDISVIAGANIVAYEMLYIQGKTKEASCHLANAHRIISETKSSMLKFLCLIVETHVAFTCDDEHKGFALLRRTMALGRGKNFFNTYWWRPMVMSSLCTKALNAGIEVTYVQNIIRKREITPDVDALAVDNWPYPLRIYTLGKFKIIKEERLVVFSRKVQEKPVSLLKALIAFGDKSMPMGQLVDVLWPDIDGYSAHRSCDLALYRLRKLLGNNKVIQLNNGILMLDERYCFVDVWTLERVIKKAEVGWRKMQERGIRTMGKKGEEEIRLTINLTERALEKYEGHFLDDDIKQPWVISLRDRLRNKFVHLTASLGRYWEGKGLYEKSVECFRRGLEIDDLSEEFYQRLMIGYHKLGRDAEAVTTYHRCHSRLKATLNLTPSLKTEEIYRLVRTRS